MFRPPRKGSRAPCRFVGYLPLSYVDLWRVLDLELPRWGPVVGPWQAGSSFRWPVERENFVMAMFVVLWNPDDEAISNEAWRALGDEIRRVGFVVDEWSTGSRTSSVHRGDDVFLYRGESDKGVSNPGIVRWGKFSSDGKRTNDPTKRRNMADVVWLEQVDDQRGGLPAEQLREDFGLVQWGGNPGGGIEIRSDYEERLLGVWRDWLAVNMGSHVDGETEALDLDDESFHENAVAYRLHRVRERSASLRQRKLMAMRRANRFLRCEACDSRLDQVYGELGDALYECHHLVPLSTLAETETRLSDLAVLCPNCHSVAHRLKPWPTIGQLRAAVAWSSRLLL
jgi:Zn finger protein HypA/HybF involved in hydrogenase expression